jgi:peptide/nickel transport system permease protein
VIRYSLRRLVTAVPVVLVGSFILFWAVRSTFDPTAKFAQSRDSARLIAQLREELGLDDPIVVQWWHWLTGFVSGDWGTSSRTNEEVTSMIWRAFGNTMQLIVWATVLSALVAIFVGVYSAVRQYSIGDYLMTGASYVGLAMPPFWFALLAIQFLVFFPKDLFNLDQSPLYFVGYHSVGETGFNVDYLQHLVLPVMTLMVQIVASWSRFQRAAMLDVLGSDYIRTARSKGLRERRVIVKHGVRNGLVPLVSVIAVDAGALFGGLIVTETIFSISGMGSLFVQGLLNGDVNVVVAWMIVAAIFIVSFNLIADLLYGALDPRVRVS